MPEITFEIVLHCGHRPRFVPPSPQYRDEVFCVPCNAPRIVVRGAKRWNVQKQTARCRDCKWVPLPPQKDNVPLAAQTHCLKTDHTVDFFDDEEEFTHSYGPGSLVT